MKISGFFKFLMSIAAIFGAAIAALAIFDKITNKNRLQGDYLDCSEPDDENTDD